MRRALIVPLLLLALAGAAPAQHSHGYLFVAPGGVSTHGSTSGTIQIGAGGEAVFGRGIGAGAELSALGPTSRFSDLIGVLSLNGYYHPARSASRLDPFVTAGYSLGFRSGHINLFNFGGGVNYWFHPKIGAKLEFRDHLHAPSGGTIHYWGVRVGLAFR
ncbi:MAG TPA: hypothetical protein VEU62_16230 [Bryobacterales bacterium]|nr:hypothetical protein [Bryobacterales bacterium]